MLRLFEVADEKWNCTTRICQHEAKRQGVTKCGRVIDSASSRIQGGIGKTPQPQDLRQIGASRDRLIILKVDRIGPMDGRIQPGETPLEMSLGTCLVAKIFQRHSSHTIAGRQINGIDRARRQIAKLPGQGQGLRESPAIMGESP